MGGHSLGAYVLMQFTIATLESKAFKLVNTKCFSMPAPLEAMWNIESEQDQQRWNDRLDELRKLRDANVGFTCYLTQKDWFCSPWEDFVSEKNRDRAACPSDPSCRDMFKVHPTVCRRKPNAKAQAPVLTAHACVNFCSQADRVALGLEVGDVRQPHAE